MGDGVSGPRPRRKDLIAFAFILPIAMALIGAVVGRAGWPLAGRVVWGAGAALTLVYWVFRPVRLPLYEAWMGVFEPVGRTVSQLLLGAVYFAIVTPIGQLLRLAGHDPLARNLRRGPGSYWVEHRPGGDPGRYLRQS